MKSIIILILLTISTVALSKDKIKKNEGRFQILTVLDTMKTTYMIDTDSGKIWRPTCIYNKKQECIYEYWELQQIEGITQTSKQIAETVKLNIELESNSKKPEDMTDAELNVQLEKQLKKSK